MNPDSPKSPREELEARLTALLLGQLSDAEATALRQTLAKDGELQRLHDRLKQTIELVRETAVSPGQEGLSSNEPKLSPERREKLLASFKVVRPKELARRAQRRVQRRELLAVAAMIIGLLAVVGIIVAVPNFTKARSAAQRPERLRVDLLATRDEFDNESDFIAPNGREAKRESSRGTAAESETRQPARGVEIMRRALARPEVRPSTEPSLGAVILPSMTAPATVPAERGATTVGQPASASANAAVTGTRAPEVATPSLGRAMQLPAGGVGISPGTPPPPPDASPAPQGEVMLAEEKSVRRGRPIALPALKNPAPVAGDAVGLGQRQAGAAGPATRTDDFHFQHVDGFWDTAGGRNLGEVVAQTAKPGSREGFAGVGGTSGAGVAGGVLGTQWQFGSQSHGWVMAGEPSAGRVAGDPIATSGINQSKQVNELAYSAPVANVADQPMTGLPSPAEGVTAQSDSRWFSFTQPTSQPADRPVELQVAQAGKDFGNPGVIGVEVQNGSRGGVDVKFKALQDIEAKAAQNESVELTGLTFLLTSKKSLLEVDEGKSELGMQLNSPRSQPVEERLYFESRRQEAVDASVPKTTTVTTFDAADPAPAKQSSLWGTIRDAFTSDKKATVRIEVPQNLGDLQDLARAEREKADFDPHWVQSEAEKVQSKAVLNEVVEKLNLNEAWSERYGGGQALKTEDASQRLRQMLAVAHNEKSGELDIKVKGASVAESTRIANAVAETYRDQRLREAAPVQVQELAKLERAKERTEEKLVEAPQLPAAIDNLRRSEVAETPARRPAANAPIPQAEVQTAENAYSTFSLNVSDVSFKLAAASLEQGQMPDVSTVRTEEFINAFDYRDPEPPAGVPIAFNWERARYPFAHNRDLLRLSVKTAATGRQPGRPLNLVLLLDNSGSMERADRVRIRQECLRVLAAQLQPQDRVSVVSFARTARLWVDGLPGNQAGELPQRVGTLTPEGGTNLEDAMNLAYQTARRHFQPDGVNRVVLLTDGAANLGDVQPESLKKRVEANRQQGVALDCFGVGWDGYNDELLETLSRNGDGRYGFINTPAAAASEFAGQLAGALRVAASDVKVQVQFNPRRVTAYRQMGYAKHQLKKEQFRDNTVDAAEIGAAEAGNALYVVEVNPRGDGPLGVVRVRFKVPGTQDYREHEWPLAYDGAPKAFDAAAPTLRLAGVAAAFSEWLVASPFAAEVKPDQLLGYLGGVPELYAADPRPKKLEWMLRQAGSLSGQ